MAGGAMTGPLAAWPYLAALLAVGAALLRAAARADKRESAFEWTEEDARKARERAEAATRWTWQEWRDELGTDFWTEEKEDVA